LTRTEKRIELLWIFKVKRSYWFATSQKNHWRNHGLKTTAKNLQPLHLRGKIMSTLDKFLEILSDIDPSIDEKGRKCFLGKSVSSTFSSLDVDGRQLI